MVGIFRNSFQLIKVESDQKRVQTWNERNVYPSEPIFVQAPNAKVDCTIYYLYFTLYFSYFGTELQEEDDGVVLSAIIWGNGDANKVGLLVLCAKTFEELGRCEFITPGPIPKCLHGWFAPK